MTHRRAYLHVGLPKTGTSFLQTVLWTNVPRLEELGFDLAASSFAEHARAVRDVMGLEGSDQIVGAWDALAERIRSSDRTVLLSKEQLGRATPGQVRRVVDSLAPVQPTVVITVRDPARQLASSWQQRVKSRSGVTLASMASAIIADEEVAASRWASQDVLAVVDRWSSHVPVERMIVVTVPPSGAPPFVLWDRLAEACGIDPSGFDVDVGTINPSLGAAQVELLRRFNLALGDRAVDGYVGMVRNRLTNDLLRSQPNQQRFGVDRAGHEWATERGIKIGNGLRDRGVRVVGDLQDLVPPPYEEMLDPSNVPEAAVATAAVDLLVGLVERWQTEGSDLRTWPRTDARLRGRRRRRPDRSVDG